MLLLRKFARKNDVPVQNRPGRVGYGFVEVVAFDQDGVESGNRTVFASTSAFEQARQRCKHRRRISLGRGRLTNRQAHFAPRHGHASHRVHHQQDIFALIAEVLGNGGRHQRTGGSHYGGLVARGNDDDTSLEPFGTQVALDELADLAAAFAQQGNHVHVGRGLPGNHAEGDAFADAATGHDADTLAASHGQESVDGAHPGGERRRDPASLQRMRRISVERVSRRQTDRAIRIDRAAQPIEHPADQPVANLGVQRTTERDDFIAGVDPVEIAEWHQHHAAVMKADDLRQHTGVGADHDAAHFADGHLDRGAFDNLPDHPGYPSVDGKPGRLGQQVAEISRQ